jgi:hypothetical protein
MTKKLCFGIDVGTRTTAIQCYDPSTRSPHSLRVHGDDVFPSSYVKQGNNLLLGGQAEEWVSKEPGRTQQLIKGFKIEFWTKDAKDNGGAARTQLKDFLSAIWIYLQTSYSMDELRGASFCFTYPAQRDELLMQYREMIEGAGFPGGPQLRFLDECSAAAMGLTWEVSQQTGSRKRSLLDVLGRQEGLVVDVGAGTTDVAVVRLDNERLLVLATRSTNRAGNDCTRGLAILAQNSKSAPPTNLVRATPSERFLAFVNAEPSQADKYKETKFSDHFKDEDAQDSPATINVSRYGVSLCAKGLDDLVRTVEDTWKHMQITLNQAWRDARLEGKSIGWVVLVGGGAQHVGLKVLFERNYPEKVKSVSDSRTVTATGAMCHITQLVHKNDAKAVGLDVGTVENLLSDSVYVDLPSDTEGGNIELFSKGNPIDVSKNVIEVRKTVRLKSNWIFSEGVACLRFGDTTQVLGNIDIDYSLFGESNDHTATITAKLEPDSRKLEVELLTQNVKLHNKVCGHVIVQLVVRGGFDRV